MASWSGSVLSSPFRVKSVPASISASAPAFATGARFCTVTETESAGESMRPSLTTRENVSTPETFGALNVGRGSVLLLKVIAVPAVWVQR
jgi:hypothetical protein